jgi:predicted DsbA family dithiol-disulfide isomerase
MSVHIRVYSHYVCPYFLAVGPLEQAVEAKDVAVEWMPFELRPYPTPTLCPEDEYLQSVWTRSVYPLAERCGVTMTLPQVSPQPYTHLAFEGFQYAKDRGKSAQYSRRVFEAFFQEGLDIGRPEVLAWLAAGVGLHSQDFRQALESRRYRDQHRQALRHAYEEARITAVPTFIVGDHALHGLQTRQTLEAAIRQAQVHRLRA